MPVEQYVYYLAKTDRGIACVTYQPRAEDYVAGPFETREHANGWLDTRHRRRVSAVVWVGIAVFAAGLLFMGSTLG